MEKIKKIWSAIWTFLNSRIFVVILIVLFIMLAAGQCKKIIDQNQEINQHHQNIGALTDSLKFEKTKNGALLVSIDGYIASEKELKKLNKGLWDEVNAQKGKVLSLNNVVVQLRQDSILLAKTIDHLNRIIGKLRQIDDSTFIADWYLPYKYDSTNFDAFKGSTVLTVVSRDPLIFRHKDTYMTNRLTQIDLTWGQKIEKGKLRVFIKSEYPGFTVKSMEGVLIDPNDWPNVFKPEKRHWFTGFGIGPNISTGWNVLEAKPALIIGVGIHYNIYTW